MRFTTITAMAAAVCLLLSGCAGTAGGSGYDYSDADPSLTKNETNFFSESGWQACAIGAVVGLGACMFAGNDASSRLTCAALAVPAGCGIFMGGNYLLDEMRVNYKTKEEQLDRMAQLVAKDNAKLSALNRDAQALLEKDKENLARLERQITDGSVNSDELNAKLADYNSNITYLQKNAAEAQKRLDQYKDVRAKLLFTDDGKQELQLTAAQREELAQLDAEIADLEESIALSTEVQIAYAESRNSLQAGAA